MRSTMLVMTGNDVLFGLRLLLRMGRKRQYDREGGRSSFWIRLIMCFTRGDGWPGRGP